MEAPGVPGTDLYSDREEAGAPGRGWEPRGQGHLVGL